MEENENNNESELNENNENDDNDLNDNKNNSEEEKEKEKELIKENKNIKDDNNKESKLSVTPPKIEKYSKKLISSNSNYIKVLSTNKKKELEKSKEKKKIIKN